MQKNRQFIFDGENISDEMIKELDLENNKIIFLYGDLGFGKTTFIKKILRFFEVSEDSITSPTYTYYNEYFSEKLGEINHFDLYRVENYENFFLIGGEERLKSGNICFVEWPELIENTFEFDKKINFLERGKIEIVSK